MKGLGFYGEDFFTIKSDDDLIRENISRILLTSPNERVMSSFGSSLKSFIFNPGTSLEEEVTASISQAIERWEPRVQLVEVNAEMFDSNKAKVKIKLINKETLEPFSYEAVIRT